MAVALLNVIADRSAVHTYIIPRGTFDTTQYINENRDRTTCRSLYTVSLVSIEIGCRRNRRLYIRRCPYAWSFPSHAILSPCARRHRVFAVRYARPIINTCINWFTADRFPDGGVEPEILLCSYASYYSGGCHVSGV